MTDADASVRCCPSLSPRVCLFVRCFSGAFGGYVPLKFVLQWLAASLAGRGVIYYPFGNPLAMSIPALVSAVNELGAGASPVSVGQMWRALVSVAPQWGQKRAREVQSESADALFEQIVKQLRAQQRK